MNLQDIDRWHKAGGEIFIENSPEIKWLIDYAATVTDRLFDAAIELAHLKGEPSPYDGT